MPGWSAPRDTVASTTKAAVRKALQTNHTFGCPPTAAHKADASWDNSRSVRDRSVPFLGAAPKGSSFYRLLSYRSVSAMLADPQPQARLFLLFRSVSRDGWTRFGSPGIFGVPTS